MRSKIIVILFFSSAIFLSALFASEEKEHVMLEFMLIRGTSSLTGDTTLEEDFVTDSRTLDEPTKKSITFFTNAKFKAGNGSLTASRNQWTWNCRNLPFRTDDNKDMFQNSLKLIGSPRILTLNNQKASFSISSVQKIEYFDKETSDTYKLRIMDDPTMFEFEMTPEITKGNFIMLRNAKISLSSIEKREQIEGLSLQVGKPIMKKRNFEFNLKLSVNKEYGFLLFPGEGQGFLICRIKANPASGNENKVNEK